MKLSDYIETNNYLAFSLTYILSGLLTLIYKGKLFSSLVSLILLIMLLQTLKGLINLIVSKKETRLNITTIIINTIVLLIALYFVDIPMAILIMIFAFYLLLNGIVKFINFYLFKKDNESGHINELLEGIIYTTLGLISLFSPIIHMKTMLNIIGIYLILIGIEYFYDFLDQKNIHLKRLRIPLPAVVDAFIPFSILKRINKLKLEEIDLDKKEEKVDLEIIVHVSEKGMGKFGHVDMSYQNNVISYGNYDKDTRKFKEGFGSGVVFIADKEKYIPFCIEESEKTLFVFGIKLKDKEKEKMEKELEKIKENLNEWITPYQKEKQTNKNINEDDYKDYSSMLYKKTNAKFYKFKTGKMKTYFVLGTNCGTLVDKILRSSGIDVLNPNGIITPGTYYDFLEREYMKKGSRVVSKKIYNKNNIKKFKKD